MAGDHENYSGNPWINPRSDQDATPRSSTNEATNCLLCELRRSAPLPSLGWKKDEYFLRILLKLQLVKSEYERDFYFRRPNRLTTSVGSAYTGSICFRFACPSNDKPGCKMSQTYWKTIQKNKDVERRRRKRNKEKVHTCTSHHIKYQPRRKRYDTRRPHCRACLQCRLRPLQNMSDEHQAQAQAQARAQAKAKAQAHTMQMHKCIHMHLQLNETKHGHTVLTREDERLQLGLVDPLQPANDVQRRQHPPAHTHEQTQTPIPRQPRYRHTVTCVMSPTMNSKHRRASRGGR